MSATHRDMLNEIERDERWLAGFETPEPDAAAMDRLRRAVDGELARSRGRRDAGWQAWHGVLAAAAAIALAVGVAWQTRWFDGSAAEGPTTSALVEAIPTNDFFPAEEATEAISEMEDDLSSLEAWSASMGWEVDGADLYEAMNEGMDASNGT